MRRQSLVAYGAPLCETVVDCPDPTGTEVLVRIERCGVCHSDLHMQDGYFKLGGDKRLDVSGGRTLPFTLGHEIAGRIERAGPEAGDPGIGRAASIPGSAAARARHAGPVKKTSAATRAISESWSTVASQPTRS
jgi:alcohol dehydrogenase